MTRTAARVDANQREIVKALRRAGCTVQPLHAVGQGVPDLLVGLRGSNWLIEVKGTKGKLTATQVPWHEWWGGQVAVVRSIGEALRVVGIA